MRRVLTIVLICAFIATLCFAKTRWLKPEPFTLHDKQSLRGTILEYTHVVWPQLRMQLLKNNKVVRTVRTDDSGKYDFGLIEPGTYVFQVAVEGEWCAPKVKCVSGVREIEGVMRHCAPLETKN